MTSTKLMLLGILIMLLGLALNSAASEMVAFRVIGADSTVGLAYSALAVFAVGFIVGVIGFFRR
ncbi:MAG TPA: hypothetical protein VFU88_08555 [Ktedonobacterales bacterium]|nr:hypothetical protein [Ktedonobacterales bacterium]